MKPKEQIRLMRWIAAGAVVVIILLAVLAVLQIPSNGGGPAPEEEVTTIIIEPEDEDVIPEDCDDECNYNLGQTNMSRCELIENETLKEECYDKWAYDSLEACLELSGENKEDCIYHHANSTYNLSICEYAANETACYIYVEPCYEYSIEERKKCLALKKDDYTYCEGNDDCLFNYSLEKNDASVCENITGNARRVACSSILEGVGKCGDELELDAEKELCWELYGTYTDDVSACFEILNGYSSTYALNCFSYFAVKNEDLSLCDTAGFEFNDLWECYIEYSLGSGDLQGCHDIHELATTNKFTCYFEYAKKYGNPGTCDYLTDTGMKNTCYQGSILGNENINYEYCSDVGVDTWRFKCYTEYAKFNDDPSVCDYIEKVNERQGCIDNWEAYNED